MLKQSRLKELYTYSSENGIFTRNISCPRVRAGEISGSLKKDGYITIRIDQKAYQAHRLAWLYVHGSLPDNDIDHINQNRSDNRIDNLRHVTRSTNRKNAKFQSNNTSGYTGIHIPINENRVRSLVKHNGKYTSKSFKIDDNLDRAISYALLWQSGERLRVGGFSKLHGIPEHREHEFKELAKLARVELEINGVPYEKTT